MEKFEEDLNKKIFEKDNYCEICSCNYKDKEKHIKTKKHKKEYKDCLSIYKDFLIDLMRIKNYIP